MMPTDIKATSGDRALFMTQFRDLGYSIPGAWALADELCDAWNDAVDGIDGPEPGDPE